MDQIEKTEFKANISDIRYINDTTCILIINTDEAMQFNSGQYAMLKFAGHDYKPFSIASFPKERKLEFHIKNSGYGIGKFILENLKINDEVSVQIPFGVACLKDNNRPILAIAGGVGIGQIGSIIDTALKNNRNIELFYGAYDFDNLYMFEYYNNISQNNFKFTPAIEAGKHISCKLGKIGDITLKNINKLADYDVYISGPPDMVKYTVKLLIDNSVNADNIYCDLPIEICLKD